jgi:LysM repeat protein
MEENTSETSPNTSNPDTAYSPDKQLIVGVSVTLFLVVVGFLSYAFIKGHISGQSGANKNVLSSSTGQITPIQNDTPIPQNSTNAASDITPATESNSAPAQTNNKTCSKNGPAQKWEYLVPYVVKDGDTLQSIATTQLNDASRVNEILQINGQGPYVVGSTLYLPPASITKSSGNLKEVSGMLVEKNSSFWHISYSSDPKGLGVLIPAFWFDGVSDSDSFAVGSCIKVLFDDGNKVYSVALQ